MSRRLIGIATVWLIGAGWLAPRGADAQGVPAAPTGVTATAATAQVTVAWTTVTGATSYDVYRAVTSGQEGTTPYATGITTPSYVNTGLTNGTKYFYQVTALNASGQGAKSAEVFATPGSPPAPTSLTATAVTGANQINLAWAASSGATAYNVYRGTSSNSETVFATGITTTSYTASSGVNGTTYYFKVTATNPYESGFSNEANALDTGPPPVPTGLALQTGVSTDGEAALTWNASATATTYNVWRADIVGTYQYGLTTTSFTDVYVTDGVQYSYQVSAANSYGDSGPSAVFLVTPVSSLAFNATPSIIQAMGSWQQQLPPPTQLKVTDLSLSKSIRIDWTSPSPTGLPGFHTAWQRSTNPTFPTGSTTTGSTWDEDGGSYVINYFSYTNGTTYYYRIQTVPNNASNFMNGVQYVPSDSIAISVTPGQVTAVDNQAIDARYDLRYGNPTFLDFEFGSMTFGGGLYIGNSTDNSRMGRSIMRFVLPDRTGQNVWAGGVNVYFEGAVSTGSGWTIGAQAITDNGWTAPTVSWDTAPSFTPSAATSTTTVSYNKADPQTYWCHWNLNSALQSALVGGGNFDVGLAMTTEASDQTNGVNDWTYFCKKEFDSTRAPSVVWGVGSAMGPATMSLNPTSLVGSINNSSQGTVTLLAPAPTGGATVYLYTSGSAASVPPSVTVLAGQTSATFTVGTSGVGQTTPTTIYGVYDGASVGAILSVLQ